MQCPKCRYEPTLAEVQRSPNGCVSCGEEYGSAESASAAAAPSGAGRKVKGRVLLLSVFALAAVIGAGYFGFSIYTERLVTEQVNKEVKLASAYVSQVLTAVDDSGSMTFSEFFTKANKAVTEIDSIAVRLSVIEPQNEATAAGIHYAKKSQEVIRGTANSMRAILSLSSAKDREKNAKIRTESSNQYVRDSGYEAVRKALDDQIETLGEMKKIRTDLATSAKELQLAGDGIKGVDRDSLVSPPLLERLTKFNE